MSAQVREVVYEFYSSRYAACLARLARLLPVLRLDLHLAPHVDTLYSQACCTSWSSPARSTHEPR